MNLLPGPVPLSATVRAALAGPERSHREPAFQIDLERLRDDLCGLAGFRRDAGRGGADVQVLTGTGTAANDAVAGQLSLRPGPGLVLSNGEFGERLIDHAERWRLDHAVCRQPWGAPFDQNEVTNAALAAEARWIWAVHGETSTGGLNDLRMLKAVAAKTDAALAIDAISSLGATPVDLSGVSWATSVSGKSLRAPPGLAFVFHARPLASPGRLPRALDLGWYAACDGVPFTLSSSLVAATAAALDEVEAPQRFAEVAALSNRLVAGIRTAGLVPFAREPWLPGVVTIVVPPPHTNEDWIEALATAGVRVNRSGYLRERSLMQFAVFGRATAADVDRLAGLLRRFAGGG
ncbi:aminotransferase class V-fold PLP-dependent enzyme [Alienimonas chondri]|uniref:aminotransferase class V-fold PLP-dependent enzyme n=1 Tax=Alienimonas chondri TaxID=2681879 RepID=UPI0014890C0E|nr:aminotransferase class V-fold PLP-dependent enzyme [Alienimonas chondri]